MGRAPAPYSDRGPSGFQILRAPRHSGAETSGHLPASLGLLPTVQSPPSPPARLSYSHPGPRPGGRGEGLLSAMGRWGCQWIMPGRERLACTCVHWDRRPGLRQAGAGAGIDGSSFLKARTWGLVSRCGVWAWAAHALAPFLASRRHQDCQCPLAAVPGVGPRPGAGLRGHGARGPHPSGQGSPPS